MAGIIKVNGKIPIFTPFRVQCVYPPTKPLWIKEEDWVNLSREEIVVGKVDLPVKSAEGGLKMRPYVILLGRDGIFPADSFKLILSEHSVN